MLAPRPNCKDTEPICGNQKSRPEAPMRTASMKTMANASVVTIIILGAKAAKRGTRRPENTPTATSEMNAAAKNPNPNEDANVNIKAL